MCNISIAVTQTMCVACSQLYSERETFFQLMKMMFYWFSNVLVTSEKDNKGFPSWWSVYALDGYAKVVRAVILAILCRVDGDDEVDDDVDDVPCNRCCAIDNVIGWYRPMMTCWIVEKKNFLKFQFRILNKN